MISVIIPVYNEEVYIRQCLDSILESDFTLEEMEILLVDGGSQDKTVDIVKEYMAKYSNIQLFKNPKKIVPVAMNIGIREAKGDYIIRLDAHASYPKDYFSKLIAWHQKLDADNIGGIVRTEIIHQTSKTNAIKKVLSHPLGVGNSDFRVGVDEVKKVDTVPFGCYPKEVFEKYGYYDERLVRNQDIELNKRIINSGGEIYLVPDVSCVYYARESFKELAKNNFANGYWNILTAFYTGAFRSLSLRHFIPLLFLLSLIIPMIAALWYPSLVWISLFSLASYLSLVIIISLKLKNSTNSIGYLILSFLTLHLSYGWGSLMGMFSVFNKYIKGSK